MDTEQMGQNSTINRKGKKAGGVHDALKGSDQKKKKS